MILGNEFARACKRLGHIVENCSACGAPYCLTERKCLAGAVQIELTPELLGVKFRRDLKLLERIKDA